MHNDASGRNRPFPASSPQMRDVRGGPASIPFECITKKVPHLGLDDVGAGFFEGHGE